MLLFLALIAILSLNASGLPTASNTTSNTTDVAFGNSTDVKGLWFNPNPRCWWDGTDMTEMPGECRCWESGPGVDRVLMLEAMTYACDKLANGMGEPTAEYGLGPELSRGGDYWYSANNHNIDYEDIYVAATLHVQESWPACEGPFRVSWQYCYDSLRATVDACNTEGENGKHGGYHKWDCLTWVLDPHPLAADRWPYYGLLD